MYIYEREKCGIRHSRNRQCDLLRERLHSAAKSPLSLSRSFSAAFLGPPSSHWISLFSPRLFYFFCIRIGSLPSPRNVSIWFASPSSPFPFSILLPSSPPHPPLCFRSAFLLGFHSPHRDLFLFRSFLFISFLSCLFLSYFPAAMAGSFRFCIALTALLLLLHFAVAVDQPTSSPAPAPFSGAEVSVPPPPTLSPSDSPAAPSPSPYFGSPPAPPTAPASSPSLSPDAAPTPSPSVPSTPSPSPSSDAADTKHATSDDEVGEQGSSGGLTGGQKAGIAIGVIASAAVLGFGCLLCKKRRDNIQRSRYGYAARREIL